MIQRFVCSMLYLDLLNAVDNEHVLQVLYSSVHPVVEGRRPLGKLKVQLVNGLPQFLNTLLETTNQCQFSLRKCQLLTFCSCYVLHLQCIPPLLGEGPQVVPLVTDALAASIDCGSIMVVKLTRAVEKKKEYTMIMSRPNFSGTHLTTLAADSQIKTIKVRPNII